jgi:hypothetical protein
MSVKDRGILAPMACLELCTDRMLGFMGPDKPSSFCNYYVESYLPASCDAFTFWREIKVEGQDFIPGAGVRFRHSRDLRMLLYVRASGSQAYGVLVRFFPCRLYIDSSHHDTLSYE